MENRSEFAEDINDLSIEVEYLQDALEKLSDSYRALATDATAVLDDVSAADEELGKLIVAIESGEVSIDKDSEFMVRDLIEAQRTVRSDLRRLHDLYPSVEAGFDMLRKSASNHQDITNVARNLHAR